MTLEIALTTAVCALSAAVAAMWVQIQKELVECKRDRDSLREMITQHIELQCSVVKHNEIK